MISKFLAATGGAVIVGIFVLSLVEVQAAETCVTPGTVAFANLAEAEQDILPSTHRQLSALGRLAFGNSCQIVLTCVSDPSLGETRGEVRDRQCRAAKAALTKFGLPRAMRTKFSDTFKVVKMPAKDAFAPGTIYVTLN